MDKDVDLGKVQILPLIAIIACHHTAVVVTVPKIFRLHFLQLKSVTQKSYVALWSDCTFGGTQWIIHMFDEQRIEWRTFPHCKERSHADGEPLIRWCHNCAGGYVYIPFTADVYHKVEENGCVETQNICVKKHIVPPKNIPCFDADKEWNKDWPKYDLENAVHDKMTWLFRCSVVSRLILIRGSRIETRKPRIKKF